MPRAPMPRPTAWPRAALAALFMAFALTALAPDNAAAQTPAATLNLGTVEGTNLNLTDLVTAGDKHYYYLDHSNTGVGDVRTRAELQSLLNGVMTMTFTATQEGTHTGNDDERSVIVGSYALILPTLMEFRALYTPTNLVTSWPQTGYHVAENLRDIDLGGNGASSTISASQTRRVAFQVITLPPAAPTGVMLTPGDGEITVMWTAVSDTSTPTLTYTNTATATDTTDASNTFTCSANSRTETDCTIASLNNGTTYSVAVVTTNNHGTSPPSAALMSAPVAAAQPTHQTLSLGPVSGINLNLILPVILNDHTPDTADDKLYYYVDGNGNGLSTHSDDSRVNDGDSVTGNMLKALFNDGGDITTPEDPAALAGSGIQLDPQTPGNHDGMDDARSVIIGNYVVVLPTANELYALGADQGGTPTDWSDQDYRAAHSRSNGRHYTYNIGSNFVAFPQDDRFSGRLAVQVITLDVTAPTAAPTAVTATPTIDNTLRIGWTAVPDADNGGAPITTYTATASPAGTFSGDDGTCTATGTAITTDGTPITCTITGLLHDITYNITVTATNSVDTGPASTAFPVIPGRPAAPTSVMLDPGNGQIIVTWTLVPSGDTGGADVTGYRARLFDSPVGGPDVSARADDACTADATTNRCTITGLTSGNRYRVVVHATNSRGDSIASDSDFAILSGLSFTPARIADQTLSVDQPNVTIVLPAAGAGIPPYTYTLTRSDDATPLLPSGLAFDPATHTIRGTPDEAFGTNGGVEFLYTATDDGTPPDSGTLTFRLTVNDDALLLGSRNGINFNLRYPVTVNGKVYYHNDHNNNNTAEKTLNRMTGDDISLSNLRSLLNGGNAIPETQPTGHNGIDDARSAIVGDYTLVLPTIAEMRALRPHRPATWFRGSYHTATASNGDRRFSFATGISTAGDEDIPWTVAFQVIVTNATAPTAAPTGVTALPTTDGALHIDWTPVHVRDNGGERILTYTATATPAGTFTGTAATCTADGANADNCDISDLTNDTIYSITVAATNIVGVSTFTSTAFTVIPGRPAAPTGVTLTPDNEQIMVTWTAVPDGNNGGNDVTSYTAYPFLSPDGGTEGPRLDANACTTPDAATTDCTIMGLTNGNRYRVVVYATNGRGDSIASSGAFETPMGDLGLTLTPGALTMDEGGTATYTAVLGTLPSDTVTVTISSNNTYVAAAPTPLTFTTTDWNTAQTVIISAAEDDDAVDETSVTLMHTAAGGDYAGETGTVVVTVTDNDTAALALTPAAALTMDEGGNAIYTVALVTQPTDGVNVTIGSDNGDVTATPTSLFFTRSNWATVQNVTLSAAEDADAAEDMAILTHEAMGGDYTAALVTAALTVTVTDNDTPALTLTKTTVTMAEGGTATYTVALTTTPSAAVTVTITGHAASDVTPTPAALTFTTANSSPQTVTLTAAPDTDTTADADVTLTHAATGGDYASVTDGIVTVTVIETGAPNLLLTPNTLSLAEGGTATHTVALTTTPAAAVTVAITGPASTDVIFTPAALTFTADDFSPQTVTLTAGEDNDTMNDSATLTYTASGGDSGNYDSVTGTVEVTVTDNATPPMFSVTSIADRIYPITVRSGVDDTVVIPNLILPEASGGIGALNYELSPAASVGIPGTSLLTINGKPTICCTPSRVESQVFTYTVTDSATPDAQTASLTFKISVVDVQGDGTAVADVDGNGTVLAVNDVGTTDHNLRLSLPDGHSVLTFTVTTYTPDSATAPDGYIFSGVAMDIDLTPASMHATTPSIPEGTQATVCLSTTGVTGNTPALFLGDGGTGWDKIPSTTTRTGFVCGNTRDFAPYFAVAYMSTATTPPGTTPSITLSETTLRLVEGSTATYTVALATRPSAMVTVTIGSDNSDVAADPTSLTFTTTDWRTAQTVTITAAGDTDTTNDTAILTHTAAGGDYGGVRGTVMVTVIDNSTPNLLLPSTLTLDEGTSTTYTVALTTTPSAAVTVTITGHDSTDVTLTPDVLTFTTANSPQTLTFTAGDDNYATDRSATLTHTATGVDYNNVTANLVVTISDTDPVLTFSGSTVIDNQIYTANNPITSPLTLPAATGGIGILTYTLVPEPLGLTFNDPTPRVLSGTPTVVDTHVVTYTVADGATPAPQTISLTFNVMVVTPPVTVMPGTTTSLTLPRVDRTGASATTVMVMPSAAQQASLTFSVGVPLPSVPGAPGGVEFGVTVDIVLVGGVVSEMATVCLPTTDVPDGSAPLLYHYDDNTWERIGDDIATHEGFVCGETETFSAFALGWATATPEELNEQLLSRASQAMTASVSARVAARVEAAAGSGGINSTGDPSALAYQFGGQSSMRGLLQAHGKTMLEGEMDYERLLDGASFVLPLSAAGDEGGKLGALSLWGGSDFSNLDGNAGDLDWDGELVSFHLGVDAPVGNKMLAGLALSLNNANFDYTDDGQSGDYEYYTTNLHPYLGYIHSDKLNFWGAAGFGEGEIEIKADNGENAIDTTHLSLAGGFSNQIARAPGRLPGSVISLNIKGDASVVQVEVDANSADGIAAQKVSSNHIRLLMSGEHRRELAGGGSLAPSLEAGVRYDGGDGAVHSGIEIGAGLRYAQGKLTLNGNVRGMLLDDYDAWGADFTVRLAPQSGRGLSLSLQPVWGQTQSTAERLWDDGAGELGGGDTALQSRMDSEVGYGLEATMLGSAGVLTPYAGMTTADGGVSHVRLGGRFAGGDGVRLNLEGARGNGDDASHTVLLRGELAF